MIPSPTDPMTNSTEPAGGHHTPGPWQVVPAGQAEHRWVAGDAEGGSIASCEPMGPWMTMREADANTRLIAAAPDMAKALRSILDWYGGNEDELADWSDCMIEARRAITKLQEKAK